MKRSILRALALCLTTVCLAGYARADDNDQSGSKARKDSQGGPGQTSGAYTGAGGQMQAGQMLRVSKLMNNNIRGQGGESLGQIQDVIADPSGGQLQFVVISLSTSAAGAPGAGTGAGVGAGKATPGTAVRQPGLGSETIIGAGATAGGKLVAVPWRLVNVSGTDQFTLNVDRTKLQSAPTFSATAWPTMDSAWSQRIHTHFGVSGTGTGAPGTGTGIGTGTDTDIRNRSTPGLPSTPGTPDIAPPGGTRTPGTSPGSGSGAGGAGGAGTGK